MNWIFHTRKQWFPDGNCAYQLVYLRARTKDEDGNELESKIIDIHITALDLFFKENLFDSEDDKKEMSDIYFNKIGEKDYYLDYIKVPKQSQEIFLNWAKLYIREVFNKDTLKIWLKIYLAILGYPCNKIIEGSYNDFADTNPVMQIFSLKNVQKYEHKFGKEWWNKHKKSESKYVIDENLIEKLLKDIKKEQLTN